MGEESADTTDEKKAVLDSVVSASCKFAGNVYMELTKSHKDSVLVCPLSLQMALVATYFLTTGRSASELKTVLNMSDVEEDNIRAYTALVKALEGPVLKVSDKVFVEDDANLKQKFQEHLMKHQKVLSQNPIKELVIDSQNHIHVTPYSKLYPFIKNNVSFKRNFSFNLCPKKIIKIPFYLSNNRCVKVAMMLFKGCFGIFHDCSYHATFLRLRSEGGFSMVIVLPDQIDGLTNLEHDLNIGELSGLFKNFVDKNVKVFLPRFRLGSKMNYNKICKCLGIRRIFEMNKSDLENPSVEPIFVSDVSQEASLEVKEKQPVRLVDRLSIMVGKVRNITKSKDTKSKSCFRAIIPNKKKNFPITASNKKKITVTKKVWNIIHTRRKSNFFTSSKLEAKKNKSEKVDQYHTLTNKHEKDFKDNLEVNEHYYHSTELLDIQVSNTKSQLDANVEKENCLNSDIIQDLKINRVDICQELNMNNLNSTEEVVDVKITKKYNKTDFSIHSFHKEKQEVIVDVEVVNDILDHMKIVSQHKQTSKFMNIEGQQTDNPETEGTNAKEVLNIKHISKDDISKAVNQVGLEEHEVPIELEKSMGANHTLKFKSNSGKKPITKIEKRRYENVEFPQLDSLFINFEAGAESVEHRKHHPESVEHKPTRIQNNVDTFATLNTGRRIYENVNFPKLTTVFTVYKNETEGNKSFQSDCTNQSRKKPDDTGNFVIKKVDRNSENIDNAESHSFLKEYKNEPLDKHITTDITQQTTHLRDSLEFSPIKVTEKRMYENVDYTKTNIVLTEISTEPGNEDSKSEAEEQNPHFKYALEQLPTKASEKRRYENINYPKSGSYFTESMVETHDKPFISENAGLTTKRYHDDVENVEMKSETSKLENTTTKDVDSFISVKTRNNLPKENVELAKEQSLNLPENLRVDFSLNNEEVQPDIVQDSFEHTSAKAKGFLADHPFAFFIYHQNCNIPIFIGRLWH